MAQPVERAAAPGTKVGKAIDETIRKAGRALDQAIGVGKRCHDDFSKLNRADVSAGGGTGDCRSGIPKLAAAFEEENKGPM
jgi:hypothetical protein